MTKKEFIDQWVYERTHQVEKTTRVAVNAHCYDDGQGKYCVSVQLFVDKRLVDTLLGGDAATFLEKLNNALDE